MVLGHDGEPLQRFDGRGDGLARFVADLRAGSAPSVSFPVAQRSADLAHLVSLAYRTAPAQAQAPRLEIVRDLADVAVALQSVDAMDQHLARQGWNLHQLAPRRSGWQAVTATGEFADLPRANDLRVRTYRAPFTPGGSLRPG
jgi:hypothetical protein